MSTTVRTSDPSNHRRRPRAKRPPSSRDQAIYVAYRSTGRTQAELAEDYHLSQRRISAIVQRVERWVVESPTARLQLDRRQERERSQAIYDRAIRAFDHAPKQLKTARKGQRDGKPFEEETYREQPPPAQLLRTALSASREISRLSDKPPPPGPEKHAQEKRENVEQWLVEMRQKALESGKVKSNFASHIFVRDIICAMLGEFHDG